MGLANSISKNGLNVFESGNQGLDFNTSTHIAAQKTIISFITNNLKELIERLDEHNIPFTGPAESHLGMRSIEFQDPDGILIRINEAGENSPIWLKP
jgi:hypothetical protein